MLGEFGSDVMLLIGGNLLLGSTVPGDSVAARAASFVQRVAVLSGRSGR
jgi:hypothetical protein